MKTKEMQHILDAFKTTHNKETYIYKINNMVNAHMTKLDIFGNKVLIEYESQGQLLQSEVIDND